MMGVTKVISPNLVLLRANPNPPHTISKVGRCESPSIEAYQAKVAIPPRHPPSAVCTRARRSYPLSVHTPVPAITPPPMSAAPSPHIVAAVHDALRVRVEAGAGEAYAELLRCGKWYRPVDRQQQPPDGLPRGACQQCCFHNAMRLASEYAVAVGLAVLPPLFVPVTHAFNVDGDGMVVDITPGYRREDHQQLAEGWYFAALLSSPKLLDVIKAHATPGGIDLLEAWRFLSPMERTEVLRDCRVAALFLLPSPAFERRLLLLDMDSELLVAIAAHEPRLLLTCRTLRALLRSLPRRDEFLLASLHGRITTRKSLLAPVPRYKLASRTAPVFVDCSELGSIDRGYYRGWLFNSHLWPVKLDFSPDALCNQILHLIRNTPKGPTGDQPVTEVSFLWAGACCFSIMFNPEEVDTLWCYEGALERHVGDVREVSRIHSLQALRAVLFRSREVRIPLLDMPDKTLRCNGLVWSIALSRIYDDVNRDNCEIGRFRWVPMGRS